MAALHWLVQGYGYDIASDDVIAAYDHTIEAAVNAGLVDETVRRVHALVATEAAGEGFVATSLARRLQG